MDGNLEIGLKAIGAGMAMVGALGPGGRNPDVLSDIQTNMILGIVFAEAVAIYCLVVALIILFVF